MPANPNMLQLLTKTGGLAAMLNINEGNYKILSQETPANMDSTLDHHLHQNLDDVIYASSPDEAYMIESGRSLKNGGQQFYESLLRQ